MSWVARVIRLFREGEGHLPKDLAEVFRYRLPTGRSSDPTTDFYKHALIYKRSKNGRSFSVESLGKDGKRGGRHADADVIVRVP